uniref:Ig-like domain-containing protein n=1 Tax=Gopherus agassizii TaxID=38772 RepID=A0A452GJQ8_9SAUR
PQIPWNEITLEALTYVLNANFKLLFYFTEEDTLHSPIFIQEPYDISYSIGSEDPEILLNCTAKGYPLPYYRWKQNGRDIDLTMSYHYRLVGGSLAINNPHTKRDTGTYQCLATNSFGTILSRKAKLQFACKLLRLVHWKGCEDSRRFVSQETGNLYIAKVELSDVGNYTCVVTNAKSEQSVRGPPTPLILRSDVLSTQLLSLFSSSPTSHTEH